MCVHPNMLRNSITGGDSYVGEVKRERGIAADTDGIPRSRTRREGKDVRNSADEQGDSPLMTEKLNCPRAISPGERHRWMCSP
jgi:hypothetical protein